jgi:hypothetical protein
MVRDAPGGLERKTGTASLSRRTPHRAPDYVADPDAVVERLLPFDVICVMRERTLLPRCGDPLSWLNPSGQAIHSASWARSLVVPRRVASQSDISGAEPALSKSAKC